MVRKSINLIQDLRRLFFHFLNFLVKVSEPLVMRYSSLALRSLSRLDEMSSNGISVISLAV